MSLNFLLTLFILIVPIFGKAIDPQESIILYSSILLFYFFSNKKSKLLPNLSPKFIFVQILLIVLLTISTILSKNIGYAYYQLFKFFFILVTLNLCLIHVSRSSLIKYLLAFSIFYSFVFLLEKFQLITLTVKPSSDNFILQIWGHSYLADFIILSIPPILFGLVNPTLSFIKNKFTSYALLAFLLIVLIFTNSRSAMIAITISGLFIYLPKFKKIFYPIFITLSLIVVGWLVNQSLFQTPGVKSWDGSRPEYWQQAAKAFINSPLFGQGPGNFFYINKLYQSYPNSDTNYPHNSVLESLSLNGFPYTFIFFGLIIYGLIHKYHRQRLDFIIGLTSLLNSLLDPSWSSFGILVITLFFIFNQNPNLINPPSKNNPEFLQKYFPPIIICLCLIFLISKTTSDLLFNSREYQKSILVDPFNNNPRLAILPQNIESTISLYANDHFLYQRLTNLFPLPQSEPYYYHLFDLSPKENLDKYTKLGNFYLSRNQLDNMKNLLDLASQNININESSSSQTMDIAKITYKLAIQYWQNQKPDKSIGLLKTAINFSKGWSHFHIELANAYWHNNQKDLAINQLETICYQNEKSRQHCLEYLKTNLNNFPLPGLPAMKQAIEEILP